MCMQHVVLAKTGKRLNECYRITNLHNGYTYLQERCHKKTTKNN